MMNKEMMNKEMYSELYDKLCAQIHDSTTDDEKVWFIDNIKTLSDKEHKAIFALIKIHQTRNDPPPKSLPYNAKHQKKGVKLEFDALPVDLQSILISYIKTQVKN